MNTELLTGKPEPAQPIAVTVAAAARKIGCSEQQLRKLINRGEGPAFFMIGKVMMLRQKSIDKWLDKRERESLKILKRNRALAQKFTGTPKTKVRAVKAEMKCGGGREYLP